jgi:hypothetical protein
MPLSRTLLLFTLFLGFSSQVFSQCSGSMTIVNPGEGARVSSHFQIDAAVASSCSVAAVHVYIDSRLQFAQFAQAALSGKFNAAPGLHTVVIQAWASDGKIFSKTVHVTVDKQEPSTCTTAFDPNVKVCQPVNLLETKDGVLLHAAARSTVSTVVLLQAFVGGQLRAAGHDANATEIEATLTLPRGLQNINVVAKTSNGLEFQNQANVQVVSATTVCQPPFLSNLTPTGGDEPEFPPFLVAADAAGCPITALRVYVDDQLFYSQSNQKIFEGRLTIGPGQHRVVLQGWNSQGTTSKKLVNIDVTGTPEPVCIPDADPGVIICQAEVVENNYVILFTGTSVAPKSAFTALRIYVDGSARATFYGFAAQRGITFLRMGRGTHKVVANAWTQKGEVVSDTATVTIP